jgi:hypothetical protein
LVAKAGFGVLGGGIGAVFFCFLEDDGVSIITDDSFLAILAGEAAKGLDNFSVGVGGRGSCCWRRFLKIEDFQDL